MQEGWLGPLCSYPHSLKLINNGCYGVGAGQQPCMQGHAATMALRCGGSWGQCVPTAEQNSTADYWISSKPCKHLHHFELRMCVQCLSYWAYLLLSFTSYLCHTHPRLLRKGRGVGKRLQEVSKGFLDVMWEAGHSGISLPPSLLNDWYVEVLTNSWRWFVLAVHTHTCTHTHRHTHKFLSISGLGGSCSGVRVHLGSFSFLKKNLTFCQLSRVCTNTDPVRVHNYYYFAIFTELDDTRS